MYILLYCFMLSGLLMFKAWMNDWMIEWMNQWINEYISVTIFSDNNKVASIQTALWVILCDRLTKNYKFFSQILKSVACI